uniref:Uncharacterized protein n=1 Tax=Anguilla anguilla TaxID=7936 RepID=A0A0E9RFV7_ANGAN
MQLYMLVRHNKCQDSVVLK